MTINKTIFFKQIRETFGPLRQSQVNGVNSVLDECTRLNLTDPRHVAYVLSTAWHETGPASRKGHMQPITERGNKAYFDKYDAGTKIGKVLGNTIKGDGYRFLGRGYVQLTGRANYVRAGKALGVDLAGDPDLALEPQLAARIIVLGMRDGWFTGAKLSNYLNAAGTDFRQARRIVNRLDKADLIAGYAKDFHEALRLTGKPVQPIPLRLPPDVPLPPRTPPAALPVRRWWWQWWC